MTQHIINVSGGKDSEACYTLAARQYANRIGAWRAIFCDTGNEHALTLEHVATMHERIGGPKVEVIRADFTRELTRKRVFVAENWPKHGIPQEQVDRAVALLQSTGNPFLDLCVWKGRFPSRRAQFCTHELKQAPMASQVVLPALKTGPVLQWIGVRRDESANRGKTGLYACGELRVARLWYPIRHWSAYDVFSYLAGQGISPNPLYLHGMSRVGCFPCINCRKSELAEIAARFPAEIERIAEWEMVVRGAAKRAAGSFFCTTHDPMAGAQHVSNGYGIKEAVDWAKTSRGGKQHDLEVWLNGETPPACSSVYGLCE